MTGCVHGIRGPVCPECPNGVMTPAMTLDLDELERKAKAAAACRPEPWTPLVDSSDPAGAWIYEIGNVGYDGQLPTPIIEHACAANPSVVLALIERVRDLDRVAKAVRGITKDVAENDGGADCPYVTQEEARELLAIIDGVKSA